MSTVHFKLIAFLAILAMPVVAYSNIVSNPYFDPSDTTSWAINDSSNMTQEVTYDETNCLFLSTPSCLQSSANPNAATISQSLTTTPGTLYSISFIASANTTNSSSNQIFELYFNGTDISVSGNLAPFLNVTANVDSPFEPVYSATSTGDMTTIQFDILNDVGTYYVSDVFVSPAIAPVVPEPSTWLTLGSALMIVPFALRKMRKA